MARLTLESAKDYVLGYYDDRAPAVLRWATMREDDEGEPFVEVCVAHEGEDILWNVSLDGSDLFGTY